MFELFHSLTCSVTTVALSCPRHGLHGPTASVSIRQCWLYSTVPPTPVAYCYNISNYKNKIKSPMLHFKISLLDLMSLGADLPPWVCRWSFPRCSHRTCALCRKGTQPQALLPSPRKLRAAFLREKRRPHCTTLPANAAWISGKGALHHLSWLFVSW